MHRLLILRLLALAPRTAAVPRFLWSSTVKRLSRPRCDSTSQLRTGDANILNGQRALLRRSPTPQRGENERWSPTRSILDRD